MEQETRTTITIKLKPYLQEYLKCKLKQEDVTANRTFVGVIVKPLISYRPMDVKPSFTNGDEYITIELPTYMDLEIRRGSVFMTESNQEQFERILNWHFWDLFFQYMDDKVRYMSKENTRKGSIKKCILQFCSDYNISYNHLNYEMMKKAYYRRRAKEELRSRTERKSHLFAKKLSLNCPLFFLI